MLYKLKFSDFILNLHIQLLFLDDNKATEEKPKSAEESAESDKPQPTADISPKFKNSFSAVEVFIFFFLLNIFHNYFHSSEKL